MKTELSQTRQAKNIGLYTPYLYKHNIELTCNGTKAYSTYQDIHDTYTYLVLQAGQRSSTALMSGVQDLTTDFAAAGMLSPGGAKSWGNTTVDLSVDDENVDQL